MLDEAAEPEGLKNAPRIRQKATACQLCWREEGAESLENHLAPPTTVGVFIPRKAERARGHVRARASRAIMRRSIYFVFTTD